MTSQEVYDRIVAHLRSQGKQAQLAPGSCVYRTEDGLKCAAGCLIDDEEYSTWMEGKNFQAVLVSTRAPQSLVDRLEEHGNIIMRMQIVHDDYQPEDWEPQLQKAASDLHLQYTAPEEGK